MENNKNIIEDFHICPGIGWSLYQAIEYIEKIVEEKAIVKVNKKRNYDVEKFIGDTSKSKSILNTREFLTLEKGLQKAIPLYLNIKKPALHP